MITNGSFEELVFADNSTAQGIIHNTNLQSFENLSSAWDIFYTLPGWVTTAGNGIELQKNIVTNAIDGSNHVELDSHIFGSSNTVMTQTIDSLVVGAEYLLEFSYKARTNLLNDNGINVFWYDAATGFDLNMDASFAVDDRSSLTPDWTIQSTLLTAQSSTMDISFGAFGRENTLGGLIDNISLVQVNNEAVVDVPEPSIFALSLFGFALLLGSQQLRRQNNNSRRV